MRLGPLEASFLPSESPPSARELNACAFARVRHVGCVLLALLMMGAVGCTPMVEGGERGGHEKKNKARVGEPLTEDPEPVGTSPVEAGASERAHPELKILSKTLASVQRDYYDQSRVDPRKMMAYGIDALQSLLPEVVAEFDRPLEKSPTSVTLRVNTRSEQFDLSEVEGLSDATIMSSDVLDLIVDGLREPYDPDDLEYTLINGMLDTLDPHSSLLTPEAFEDMQTTHGGFGGLGIVIGLREEQLTILNPIEGTPAAALGLQSGDRITRIGEESTVNMPLHEAVDRMRGEVGTDITIFVARVDWEAAREFTITRAQIEIRSLLTKTLHEDRLGYIKIKSFERNTGEDVRKKIKEIRAELDGEIKGLILDLRENPGGLLSQATEVADIFLSEGELVIQEGVGGNDRQVETATEKDTEPLYPIVVLVDSGSASASEIVAGALKNHDRVLVVGDRTFGKGSVQSLRKNGDGSALKLTISQYLTPGDLSIQGVGIPPDIAIMPVTVIEKDGKIDANLFPSEYIRREGTLDLALKNEKAREGDGPFLSLKYLYDLEDNQDRSDEVFYEDFEIKLAREILGAVDSPVRLEMATQSKKLIERRAAAEMERIGEKLATHGLSWTGSEGAVAQPIEARVEVIGGDVIEAGSPVTIKASVTNKGTEPIYRLHAVSLSNNDVFDDREFLFGQLAPGATRTWSFETTLPIGFETRQDTIQLRFADQSGPRDDSAEAVITTQARPSPHYAYSFQLVERVGNQDGRLQRGEEIDFNVWITNNGEGPSPQALVHLKSEAGEAIYLNKGRETLGELAVGATQMSTLRFKINHPPEELGEIKLKLSIYDKEFDTSLIDTLKLPLYAEGDRVEPNEGFARARKEAIIRGAADLDGPQIATAATGTVVERVALNRDREMVQIAWGEAETRLTGWVQADQLEDSPDAPAEGAAAPQIVTLRTSPFVTFTNPTIRSTEDHYVIRGRLSDDRKVEDYFAYLWHHDGQTVHSQKLDFGALNSPEGDFELRVPLRKGINHVTMYVRDDEDLENHKDILIHHP